MIGSNNQDFRTIPKLWAAVSQLRCLDLGCGNGLYTRELARQDAFPVGLDCDLERIKEARQHSGRGKAYWVRGDVVHLPFKDATFDLLISIEVLTHLPPESRFAVLQEVRRITRDGGKIFITLHNRTRLDISQWLRCRRPQMAYDTAHLKVWPTVPAEARQMVCACGFRETGQEMYLNFHSRFSYGFFRKHPLLSRVVIIVEDLLRRLPLFRRMGITFLLSFGPEK